MNKKKKVELLRQRRRAIMPSAFRGDSTRPGIRFNGPATTEGAGAKQRRTSKVTREATY